VVAEGPQSSGIARHGVVGAVAYDHRTEPCPGLRDGPMASLSQLGLERRELGSHPLLDRVAVDLEAPLQSRPTDVGEPQKGEGLRLPLASPFSVLAREASKLDQASLVGVKLEAEACQSLAQLPQTSLRLCPMLEPNDEVIGIAHDDHVALVLAAPGLDPEIEHVVEVDVRQQGGDAPSLRRSPLLDSDVAVLQHAGV
jgi:hypothetical protein